MEIGTWLRGLGLEQYEAAFRDNDVDAEVLPELTADDLVSLGVTFDTPDLKEAKALLKRL